MIHLGKDHVVLEVGHLHLFEISHFLLARVGLDLVHLVSETPQHLAATNLAVVELAHAGAEGLHVCLAGGPQTVVETVVLVDLSLVVCDLVRAALAKVLLFAIVLEATDDTAAAMGDVLGGRKIEEGSGQVS